MVNKKCGYNLTIYIFLHVTGRRGEDLRDILLSTLFLELLPEGKPASMWVIGAAIFDPKERKDAVETILTFLRAKCRDDCPFAALAAYIVYLNDINGLNITAVMRQDLLQLQWCLRKVSRRLFVCIHKC